MEQRPYNYASYELILTSDLVDVADVLACGWVFRGHNDAGWKLESSLERETVRLKTDDRAGFEAATLKQIKAASCVGELSIRPPEDNFSWLALLQHHGCKTRLLDFTKSFYVALYFAVRDCPNSDAAVWCIATHAMDARIAEIQGEGNPTASEEEIARRLVNNSIEWPDRYKDDDRLAVVYAEPVHLNQRMIAQQGLFVCPLNLNHLFMDNLTKGLGLTGTKEPVKWLSTLEDLKAEAKDGKVVKVRIPRTHHRNILFHLRRMNISEATLFPGLDGLVRSLNYFAMGVE